MLNDQRAGTSRQQEDDDHGDDEIIRDIHALTPPHPPQAANRGRQRETWETGSHRSSSLSMASTEGASSENFTTISREFSALVVAGSTIANSTFSDNDMNDSTVNNPGNNLGLGRIGEEDNRPEETNPLAIVPDNYNSLDPVASPRSIGASTNNMAGSTSSSMIGTNQGPPSEISVHRVKKEEVESKISAWQNAKIAKLNNRFKREDAIINGWESEQVQKASSWMKKVERKMEEKRARALEKMQNDIARAHRKAEERKASAEAKRGTKVARVLEIANLMRAVGRAPAKKSFF
ncbi:remorin 4.1-like [Argentina anserina]|uniref:remorin 4.1-like n=1 Tax=Argentina anserina TaxID=57926 RepID=UPI00217625A3|nr:remorin 4.1-like [Potentilla anserina]